MIERIRLWWRIRQMRKAKLRASIARKERIRAEALYPDRETLPLGVWLRLFGRACWDSAFLRFYPLTLLRKRASGE